MITFIDERGSVVAVAQDLYQFHHYYKQGHWFIVDGIISSPRDYGTVARAIAKLMRQTEVVAS